MRLQPPKVWATTLVTQRADEGKLDIDGPVRRYLPEFRIADEAAAENIAVWKPLRRTAAFEGGPRSRSNSATSRGD